MNSKLNGTCSYENRKSNKHGFWWSLTIGATFIPTYKNKTNWKSRLLSLLVIRVRGTSREWRYCRVGGEVVGGDLTLGGFGEMRICPNALFLSSLISVHNYWFTTATQIAPVPSTQWLMHYGSNHQLPEWTLRFTSVTLLAQGGGLHLFIVVVGVVFVGGQRRDAYYRNDPSKYGLKHKTVKALNSIFNYNVEHVGPPITHALF